MGRTDRFMPLYVGDYLADTMMLTTGQHGAYLLLLMAYWRNAGPLLADDESLAATTRATPSEWRKLKPVLLRFFREEGGLWHQKRADKELARATQITEQKAAAGRAGGIAARGKSGRPPNSETIADEIADPVANECQKNTPLPSPVEVSKILNGLGGKRNGARSDLPTSEKMARFQKSLALKLGDDGWDIVLAASDRASPIHEKALALCKKAASALNKGWPHQWPIT